MEKRLDWKAALSTTYAKYRTVEPAARPHYNDSATPIDLNSFESRFACRLPESLRSLFLQSNGVTEWIEVDKNNWIEATIVVFSIEEMRDTNSWIREQYPSRKVERYCFFATAGVDGVLFGIQATSEARPDSEVIAWYPDETSDKLMAHGLFEFLEGWCTGQLTV